MNRAKIALQFRQTARSDRDLEQEYLAKAASSPETIAYPGGHVATPRANWRAAAQAAGRRAVQWDQMADRLEATP